MEKIYVFGNEYVDGDGTALSIARDLQLDYVHCHSPDDLLTLMDTDQDVVILDVVKNISAPLIITDVSKLKATHLVSLHDFDVGFFLNLMHSLGMAKHIKIIGIPMHGNKEESKNTVKAWLNA